MSARLGQWELLGEDGDPLPGDPAAVRSAARGYAQTASQIRDQVTRLRKIAEGTNSLVGKYQPALKESADTLAGQLHQSQSRFDTVAKELHPWAPVLDHARGQTGKFLHQAEDAQHDINTHQPPDAPVDAKDEHAKAADKKRATVLSDAKGELARIKRRYDDLMNTPLPDGVKAIAEDVARKIEAASHDKLDDSWFAPAIATAGADWHGVTSGDSAPVSFADATASGWVFSRLVASWHETDQSNPQSKKKRDPFVHGPITVTANVSDSGNPLSHAWHWATGEGPHKVLHGVSVWSARAALGSDLLAGACVVVSDGICALSGLPEGVLAAGDVAGWVSIAADGTDQALNLAEGRKVDKEALGIDAFGAATLGFGIPFSKRIDAQIGDRVWEFTAKEAEQIKRAYKYGTGMFSDGGASLFTWTQ